MNNKEIENNIRGAFEKIHPNQLDSILSSCKRNEVKMIFMKEKENNFWAPRLALFAASFAIVLLTIFGINVYSNSQNAVFATISLDVNPSIEIKINKNEKVLDVIALNEDAKLIVGDMDFKGSNLDVTVNALIGSLIRNGYIDDLHNSILISVDDPDDVAGKSLEEKLMAEISELLDKGSVLAQQVKTNKEIQELADKYDITLGKAQLIKELADKTTLYSYEDLAKLSINELNLLSKKVSDTSVLRNGDPSDKAYIGIDKAKETVFKDLGISEADVKLKKVELDFENKTMVYEVEFVHNNIEYDYVINAVDGEIIYVDREYERKTSTDTQVNPTPVNNEGVSNLIGEAKAKEIALSNAGVNESQISGYRIKRDYDDGVVKYEVDFYVGNVEYEYDINATTGDIIKFDKELEDDYRPTSNSKPGVYDYSGNTYKVENGVVYEYDDGRWEVESDKKVEDGVVYEYDDGRWEADSKTKGNVTYDYDDDTGNWKPDEKVENGVRYEYDDDTGSWKVDDDDDD